MQMVALWVKATNWRVLHASAHQGIENSKDWADEMPVDDEEQIPNNSPHQVWRVWTPLAPQDISLTIRCDIQRYDIFEIAKQ